MGSQLSKNGCLNLLRTEEVEGGKKEKWHPTSAKPLPAQVGSLTVGSN